MEPGRADGPPARGRCVPRDFIPKGAILMANIW